MVKNPREISGNVNHHMGRIEHDGSLTVHGDVESNSVIIATDDILIMGNVFNAKIKSLKGKIRIEGGVKGLSSIIHAQEDISVKFVYNATLKSENNIIIKDISVDAHLITKKSVFAKDGSGTIEGGELEAGVDIIANNIGSTQGSTTLVKISNFKQRNLMSQILRIDNKIKEIETEISQLSKFIDIIKILGKKVVTLPLAKKQDLALKVKKFQQLTEEVEKIKSQKELLNTESKEIDELERTVIVRNHIHQGVYVYIDESKLLIQHKYKNVILYKRGIIIIGDYDQFMHRKKYAY